MKKYFTEQSKVMRYAVSPKSFWCRFFAKSGSLCGEARKANGYSERVMAAFDTKGDFLTPDAEMLDRLTRDVWHFSGAKNYHNMRDLMLALRDEKGNLREFDDWRQQAEQICDTYNVNWMRTGYNMAIASSQNAAR